MNDVETIYNLKYKNSNLNKLIDKINEENAKLKDELHKYHKLEEKIRKFTSM